jgi:hypothetical protein
MEKNTTTEVTEQRIREIVREELEAWLKSHIRKPVRVEPTMIFTHQKHEGLLI